MKSNIENGSPVTSWRTEEMSRLGGVPISVIRPPSSEPNDKGLNSMAGERPVFSAE